MSTGEAVHSVSQRVDALEERDLLEQLAAYIERRTQDAHRRFEELARRRASLSPNDRKRARENLRAQAAEINIELARLRLADSLARALRRSSLRGASASHRRPARRIS